MSDVLQINPSIRFRLEAKANLPGTGELNIVVDQSTGELFKILSRVLTFPRTMNAQAIAGLPEDIRKKLVSAGVFVHADRAPKQVQYSCDALRPKEQKYDVEFDHLRIAGGIDLSKHTSAPAAVPASIPYWLYATQPPPAAASRIRGIRISRKRPLPSGFPSVRDSEAVSASGTS